MINRSLYKFGSYTLDAEQLLLRNVDDAIVSVPPKAIAILLALAKAEGKVVTKQELMDTVWAGSFVEEGSLTQSIFILRRELGRTIDGDDYIQTLPKRGYRLNVSVEVLTREEPTSAGRPADGLATASVVPTQVTPPLNRNRARLLPNSGALVLSAMLAAGVYAERILTARPQVSSFRQLTHDGEVKLGHHTTEGGPGASLFTDGSRVYFTSGTSESLALSQIAASGGETGKLPAIFPKPQILDLSSDGSRMLVSNQTDAMPSELWSVPLPTGSPSRVAEFHAWDASWSPSGQQIAFTEGRDLSVANLDGSHSQRIASLPGTAWMPRWSHDGKRIRFTVFDVRGAGNSIWEAAPDGSGLHQILGKWAKKHGLVGVCCGIWTPDGHEYIFQAIQDGKADIWAVADRSPWLERLFPSMNEPVRLTSGQLSSTAPTVSPDGKTLYVVGQQLRGELERFDRSSGAFLPYLGGQSMDFARVSPDGHWIVWVSYPEHELWRSRTDGSERMRLASLPMRAMMPRWSPDGSKIVFYAAGSGTYQRAYVVDADGSSLHPLQQGDGKEMLPNWSPDGRSIVYSEFPFFAVSPSKISVHIFSLDSNKSVAIAGSQGFFAAQWSPNGKYIAAISIQKHRLELYNTASQSWVELGEVAGFLNWSQDSERLYFLREGASPAVLRMRMKDQAIEEVASLKGVREAGQLAGIEFSLSPEEAPIILRDTGTQEIYSLDLHSR